MSKRGFSSTVTELYNENSKTDKIKLIPRDQIPNLIESVNQIRGTLQKEESVLFEWWKVFWNILKENKQKQIVTESNHIIPMITNAKTGIKTEAEDNGNLLKIIVEDGSKSSTINNTKSQTNNKVAKIQVTEHPYKKLKKKPVKPSTEPMNTLDISSLTGIEKSLLSANLMNKDLTKLTPEEVKRIETGLRSNKVTKESWEMYLRLCKEYQKMPQVLKNTKINYVNPNPDFIMTSGVSNTNYLGVIDQVNQPIDSRQLLLLRQTLYQEYLKKQNIANHSNSSVGSSISISNSSNSSSSISISNCSSSSNDISNSSSSSNVYNTSYPTPTGYTTIIPNDDTSVNYAPENTRNSPLNDPFDENIFESSGMKDELNFNDFMNEYLI